MNYAETIDYLFSRLPMFHRIGAAALKPGLDNITRMCALLGDPQQKFPSIHIAGTNGKGSTAHFLASILQEAGFKVGLYTSPHLKDFRERIKINGNFIPEQEVIAFVQEHREKFEKIDASFFEYTTAMAWWYFEKEKVDIAIIETGLGGRLDSTNIIVPEISVITSISRDHTNLLGNTLVEIAGEKAGIIKHNIPVVVGPNATEVMDVLRSRSLQLHSPLYLAAELDLPSDLELGLSGYYQQHNAKTALLTIDTLIDQGWKISKEHIYRGFKQVCENTNFAGRWQRLGEQPMVICDVAHNEDGIRWVVKQLTDLKKTQLRIVMGMVSDKSIDDVLALLPKDAIYYFCNADMPRALPAEKLQEQAADHALPGSFYPSVSAAYQSAKNDSASSDVIFIGGSVFVVAEIL